jgi:uncharacterized protein (TIGR00369 family)
MTWATDRLDALVRGDGIVLPPVVETLRLGAVDSWGPGWVRKRWTPKPEVMNIDGSMFGGYVAALADQILAFAAMTVLPGDKAYRTTNLNVSFFKLMRGGALDIEGRVVSQSASIIAVEADFKLEDGALAARAQAQQFLTPAPPGLA